MLDRLRGSIQLLAPIVPLILATLACCQSPSPTPIPTGTPDLTPPGTTWTRSTDGVVMVYVPAGQFEMGSSDEEVDRAQKLCHEYYSHCGLLKYEAEKPAHTVALAGFWIDQTEVTNERFATFLNEQGNQEEGTEPWLDVEAEGCLIERVNGEYRPKNGYADHPVSVTWYGAAAYCEWAGARLPTEAEWEYAARGPEERRYPWGDLFDGTRLNYCDANCDARWIKADQEVDDGYTHTAPAGSYPDGASWCEALDLAGNVWEWTASYWGTYPVEQQAVPLEPDPIDNITLRGGSFSSSPVDVRSANRTEAIAISRSGFRCARDSD